MQIGVQLYTVREHARNLNDFSETLKKIADIGYKTVQVSGTCSYEADWLREQLAATGLKCVITHVPSDRIISDTEQLAKEHSIFDCNYVGLGYYGFDSEKGQDVNSFISTYAPAAQKLKDCGKYFMYHNHAHEFKKLDSKLILEQICEAIPADQMGITLDTYWVQVGGADPAQWLEKLAGRIPCIHLKDCAYGQKMSVIGEGNINFDRVFEKAEAGGTQYMLVEQDDCGGENPFDCLKRSYLFLKSRGFE